MKHLLRTFTIVSILLMALLLSACDGLGPDTTTTTDTTDEEQLPSKVIEDVLIGQWAWTLQDINFTFTKTTVTGPNVGGQTTFNAYSEDGKVYNYDTDELLYEFRQLDPSEFDAELAAASPGGQQAMVYMKINQAKTGYFYRFTGLGITNFFDVGRWDKIKDVI
ncbi:MAG: hypothetical protein FWH12_02465 [Treponema sp.]|nr:hypothetical protein [Treponema sp.]